MSVFVFLKTKYVSNKRLMLVVRAISANASMSNMISEKPFISIQRFKASSVHLLHQTSKYACFHLLTWVLGEYIDGWIWHRDCSGPARWCPDATAGFSGSSPGAAPPVPFPLVWLRRVGLWWLECGRWAFTDAAYLLSHPAGLVYGRLGRSEQPPLRSSGLHSHELERPGRNSLPQCLPCSSPPLG